MLQNFNLCIDTNFIFKKDAQKDVGYELQKINIESVLIHHDNGAFLYASNMLQNIVDDLKKHSIEVYELGGVLPNPRLTLVQDGITLVKEKEIPFILAIGGGSVIDSAKAIAIGALYEGNVWDFYSKGIKPVKSLPVGVILTCPATGSESSNVSVVNNAELGEKYLTSASVMRPKIVFMNPELTYTLPGFLTACGIVDMFSHVCERYFSPDEEIGVIDRMSEGILRTLVNIGPKVLKEPTNYSYRAEVMWIGTIAHNDTVGIGRVQDWATHEIANELSALYDAPHGATLSIIMASWMRFTHKKNPMRFARYAKEVFSVNWDGSNTEEAAALGIEKTEEFFKQLNMPISFHDFKIPSEGITHMVDKIQFSGADKSIGAIVRLNREDVTNIFHMAL